MEKPAGGVRDKLGKLDRTLNEHGVLGDSALPVSGDMKKKAIRHPIEARGL